AARRLPRSSPGSRPGRPVRRGTSEAVQAVSVSERREHSMVTDEDFQRIDAWWRAANYLSAGQIYLRANPLLREPLRREDVKPRLLGHWGTSPGLNFCYAHLNRAITAWDLHMIYIMGPGHGGPAAIANAWLEGTYSEVYPHVSRDAVGMERLFRQFSY